MCTTTTNSNTNTSPAGHAYASGERHTASHAEIHRKQAGGSIFHERRASSERRIVLLPKTYVTRRTYYFDADGISMSFPICRAVCLARGTGQAFANAEKALGCICSAWSGTSDAIPRHAHAQAEPEPGGTPRWWRSICPQSGPQNNRVVKKTLTIPAWMNSERRRAASTSPASCRTPLPEQLRAQ